MAPALTGSTAQTREPMQGSNSLPDKVVATIERCVVAEFATITATGVPIDTPMARAPRSVDRQL